MERVAFLVEQTGERLRCLLNPESLLLRRRAGVRSRESSGGLVTGAELADDPLFFTGGGSTELTLDLLFDVSVAGSSIDTDDVRELTSPLWRLAENMQQEAHRPPVVRFLWGKAWNVPGIVTAVAERLEYFSPGGTPKRSWMSLCLRRVADSSDDLIGGAVPPPVLPDDPAEPPPDRAGDSTFVHQVTGNVDGEAGGAGAVDRLDQLASDFYGDPRQWRVLAWLNDIDDPLHLEVGRLIRVASRWDLAGEAQ